MAHASVSVWLDGGEDVRTLEHPDKISCGIGDDLTLFGTPEAIERVAAELARQARGATLKRRLVAAALAREAVA